MKEYNDLQPIDLVSSCESPVYEVAERLREEGYDIAGHMRIRRKIPTSKMIGILKDREPIQKNFLGLKWNKKQKAFYLGTIWFNDEEKEAKEDENWIFEAYGTKEMSKLTEFLKKIKPCYVKIQSTLYHHAPKRERYLHELLK